MSELKLSPREIQVLRLAGAGYTSRQIARILQLSPRTVDSHKHHAFGKLTAFSLPHALVLAHQLGFLNVGEIDAIKISIFRE